MAGRPSRKRVLDIWMNGELVGKWTFAANTRHTFSYDASWLDSPNVRPLSLSLPLAQGTDDFTGEKVENYFDNLLPDSLDFANVWLRNSAPARPRRLTSSKR